ncbi:MAG TPA: GIDE domain-containing protein [Rubrivivax sp.]|nr:GIDE domain-containing protein [Rubrivivax sp.]
MDPVEYWMVLAAVAAGGAWGFHRGFRWWYWARLIEDTPTSRVRSAAQGYTELIGTGRQMPGLPVFAPLSKRPCTWWSYTIERRVRDSRSRVKWKVVNRRISDSLFHLDDGTGLCIVDPEGAEVLPSATDTWYGETPLPAAGPPAHRGFRGLGSDYRYRESRMHDGDLVYAIGWFRTEGNVLPAAVDAEVAALLREWKRDQPALVQRFDTDGDGTLTLSEWEQAREAAHAQVLAERREQSAQPGVHVLHRPSIGGQPFLLASGDAEKLARRYRWHAVAGLTLFLLAVASLAWLTLHGMLY